MNLVVILTLLVIAEPTTAWFMTWLDPITDHIMKELGIKKPKEACFKGDSYSIGCFSTAGEFEHHILPSSPEEIVIKMHLNTRKSEKNLISTAEVLDWRHKETLDGSSFDPKKPTVIFTHGFRTAIDKHWLLDLVGATLAMDDVNALRVGWESANTYKYQQASADTRVVGAVIARMILAMQARGADLDSFWLIGHSLGAHVMGFAGRRVKVGRITGLDPAEPYFEGYGIDARLDPTDATFVDVIHTDAGGITDISFDKGVGLGAWGPMGHVDFYLNGGKLQPGCKESVLGGTCNHGRAQQVMIQAIRGKAEGRNCSFEARPCSSYEAFLNGECLQCGQGRGQGCTLLGPDARVTRPKTNRPHVKMFLKTSDKEPFCVKHMMVSAVLKTSTFKRKILKFTGKILVKIGKMPEWKLPLEKTTNYRLRRVVGMNGNIWDRFKEIKEIKVRSDLSFWDLRPSKPITVSSFSLAPIEDEKPANINFCFRKKEKKFQLKWFDRVTKPKWTTLRKCK